jgi:SAM-dependent methyltransferase
LDDRLFCCRNLQPHKENAMEFKTRAVWPKILQPLTAEQEVAREEFMRLWHEMLPQKYTLIEKFNHGFVARLPHQPGSKTLEIGAGLGEHAKFENLGTQDYHQLEYREEFCRVLRQIYPADHVVCGDAQQRLPWPSGNFDRVIAIHVLEHLPNLPAALREIARVLKPEGVFDVVLPCEGGVAYRLAREVSAKRFFEKKFKMSYIPIIRNEHVNTLAEIWIEMTELFKIQKHQFFPLRMPIANLNLVVGLRLCIKS